MRDLSVNETMRIGGGYYAAINGMLATFSVLSGINQYNVYQTMLIAGIVNAGTFGHIGFQCSRSVGSLCALGGALFGAGVSYLGYNAGHKIAMKNTPQQEHDALSAK